MALFIPKKEEFLNRYSKKTKRTYRTRLVRFVTYLESIGITDITFVQKYQIEQWARTIVEPMKVRRDTKERHWSLIRQYFDFLAELNYLPHLKLSVRWEFQDHIKKEIVLRNAKLIPEIFDFVKVIRHAKLVNPRMYIYLVLMAYNGARDSEVRSIRLANIIDANENIRTEHGIQPVKFTFFTSGFEEEHMKKGQVFYFIPASLRHSLEWTLYIKQLHYLQKPTFLFQIGQEEKFLSQKSTNRNLKKYAEKCGLGDLRWSTHMFRDVINEERMQMNCDPALRAILLNQSPEGVNAKRYLKKCQQIQQRFIYWKQYTPQKLEDLF